MAERTLAKMVHDFECSLDEYKRGNIDEDVLKANFYSDDFSCVEYYNELTKLALDSVEESRQEEKSKDDQSV